MALLVQCKNEVQDETYFTHNKPFSYQIKRMASFPLDKNTTNHVYYSEYDQETEILSLLNENTNSIYRYNYRTGDYLETIDLSHWGLNKQVQGFHFCGDTVYVYSYPLHVLYEIVRDEKCADYNEYQISHDARSLNPTPFLSSLSPMRKIGRIMLFTGLLSGETPHETSSNRPSVIRFDFNTRNTSFAVNYPKVYQKGNWGGGLFYRLPYYDLDSNGQMVISFPASDSLIVYNPETNQSKSYYAGREKSDPIHPFRKNKNNSFPENVLYKWYLKTPSYENILFDQFRGVYYRLLKLPQTIPYNQYEGTQKPIVVLIFNQSFELLGECFLPVEMRVITNNAFVTKTGLSLQVKSDNEDILSFYEISFSI